jgi:hypothetical protein
MLPVLSVHHTRIADLILLDRLATGPAVSIHGYCDGFGNGCNRIVAPAGQIPGNVEYSGFAIIQARGNSKNA